MKLLLTFTTLALVIATNCAAPQQLANTIEILSNELDNKADGSYKFSYTLSDGTKRTEEATLTHSSNGNDTLTVRGTVTWVGPDGITYTVDFVADENGYQPKGEHLPVLKN